MSATRVGAQCVILRKNSYHFSKQSAYFKFVTMVDLHSMNYICRFFTKLFTIINNTGNVRITQNREARSFNHFCSGKAISITQPQCVFFGSLRYPACNAHARIVICGLPCSTIFFHISQKTQFSKKKKLLNTKCVFWFSLQLSSETFFILRRNERDIIKSVHRSSSKVPGIPVPFGWNLNFLEIFFRKILKYQISCKSVQWPPSCSMRTDLGTDIKLIVAILWTRPKTILSRSYGLKVFETLKTLV
jgi:hypothetical protein